MAMQNEWRRTWGLGFALMSLLSVGACADVDAAELEDFAEGDPEEQADLAQLSPAADAGAAATTDDGAERVDLGVGDGKDVIMVGDSWMTLETAFFPGDGIQAAMERAGKKYRGYGYPGVKLVSPGGLGPLIPTQFDAARRQGRDIKSVIMTGGGNDVLIGGPRDCPKGGPQCTKLLEDIVKRLVSLWDEMAAAGVKDVVYIGYAEGAGEGKAPPSFANTMKNGTGEACLAMKSLRCTPIESTPIVRGQLGDGIHPTPAANDRIAAEVLKVMEQKGMRR